MIDGNHTTLDWQTHPGDVCVLPFGSVEQHSAHLPLLSDTLQAEAFARMIAEDLDAALMPTLPYGSCLEHSGFRGSFTLRPETLMQIVRDLVDEVERQHFRILIAVNGHGGNFFLNPVLRDINRQDRPVKILLVAPYLFWPADLPGMAPQDAELHSGDNETSVMLALRPDLVRPGRVDRPATAAPDPHPLGLPDLTTFGIGQFHAAGSVGHPSRGTREQGEAILAAMRARMMPHLRNRIERLRRQWRYAGAGGIAVRPMGLGDLEDGLRLKRVAGWNQTEADWRLFLETNPAGCFAAVQNGQVVGSIATIRYGAGLAWLSMVLVDPEYRRLGIGHRLMQSAMDHLQDCPSVKLDATPFGSGLYRKFGFADEYLLQRCLHPCLPPVTQPGESPVSPMTEADLPPALALDRRGFGADRSALLAFLFRQSPESAWCRRQGKTLTGFCLGRPGANFHQIGPIVAESTADAIALAAAALRSRAGSAVGLDVPDAQPEFRQWLARLGFSTERPFLRMIHGSNVAGHPPAMFAAAGPEFG